MDYRFYLLRLTANCSRAAKLFSLYSWSGFTPPLDDTVLEAAADMLNEFVAEVVFILVVNEVSNFYLFLLFERLII